MVKTRSNSRKSIFGELLMSQTLVTRRRIRRAVVIALLGSCAFVMAENIVVQKSVDVLSDKDPFSSPVETVDVHATLVKLGKDGSFIHVRTPSGKEGYITEDDLPIDTKVASISGNGRSNGADASLAGRGLEPDTEKYAQLKNLNPQGAQTMVDWGNKIKRADVIAFADQGHVGPKKYRK
jgi:hypothetical protein